MLDLNNFPNSHHIDPGAERNVIACCSKSAESWLTASFNLTVDDFAVDLNKALWLVIDSLRTKGAHVDPVVLYDSLSLQYQKELDEVGGWSYIQALQDLPINPDNVQFEINKLLDLSTRRRIDFAGDKLKTISQEEKPLEAVKEDVESTFNDINKDKDEEVAQIASKGMEFLEKRLANVTEVPGLPTGFDSFDTVIQGLQSGRLYVVGAPQKTGKSMLLLNWAKNIAVSSGHPVLWISTEHSMEDEFSRLLSLTSGVPEAMINNGTFSRIDTYADKISTAFSTLQDIPFHFASMPFFTLEKIRRVTRYMVRVHKVKVLFFDFIKTSEAGSDKEWMQLGVLAYGLKSLAMKEDIPVVTAVQINREGKQEFKVNGEIDSLYYAGSDRISHALSLGCILRQPTKKEAYVLENFRVLQISDNRHGPSGGKWLLDFQGETLTITENKKL